MAVGFHLNQGVCKMQCLQCLPEGFGRAGSDLTAVGFDGQQFLLAVFVCLSLSQFLSLVSIAQDHVGSGFVTDQRGLQGDHTLLILGIGCAQRGHFVQDFLTNAAVAQFEQAFRDDAQVTGAAGGVAVCEENAVAELAACNFFFAQQRHQLCQNVVALPVFLNGFQLLIALFRMREVVVLVFRGMIAQQAVFHLVN